MSALEEATASAFLKRAGGGQGQRQCPEARKVEGSWLYSCAGSTCPVTQGSGVYDLLLLLFLLQECTNIFSKGGGEELAKHAGVPFLGECPLEQSSVWLEVMSAWYCGSA